MSSFPRNQTFVGSAGNETVLYFGPVLAGSIVDCLLVTPATAPAGSGHTVKSVGLVRDRSQEPFEDVTGSPITFDASSLPLTVPFFYPVDERCFIRVVLVPQDNIIWSVTLAVRPPWKAPERKARTVAGGSGLEKYT